MSELTPALLGRLRGVAESAGIARLGVVPIDHPGFADAADALDEMLERGRHGDMEYLARSRATRRDPSRMLLGARSLVVGLVPHGGEASPVARYAQHRDYHEVLHDRLGPVRDVLHAELEDVRSQICVDSRPILERATAALAGLGFLGKNGCLIVPGLGSYLLIGAILTTARWSGEVVAAGSSPWEACGSCTRCIDACPTEAFVAPGALDARRCISYLTIEHRGPIPAQLAGRMGERIAGCDVCQEVCPYNATEAVEARVPEHAWIEPPPRGPRAVDLEAVANLGSSPHRALVKHTPLTRIPRRHLRRNALIALGNRTTPLAPRERDALERAQRDPEPLVSNAATWALARRDPPQSS